MITKKDFCYYRDKKIYESFMLGDRQKQIAEEFGLSESRVKAICAEQRKLEDDLNGR